MARFSTLTLLAALPLALAACDRNGAGNDAAAVDGNGTATAADAANAEDDAASAYPADMGVATNEQERVDRTVTAEGTFKGWEAGDYLWAQFELPGNEAYDSALVNSTKIAAFLNAHKGQKITVQLDMVNMYLDAPGERVDVTKVGEARIGDRTAAAWWDSLTAEQRQAAQAGVSDAMGSAGQ